MTFDEAMKAAGEGRKLTLPHWCWLYVSRDERGKVSLFNDDDEREALYRATRSEKRASEWMDYQHNVGRA